jgi:hypothetical protein
MKRLFCAALVLASFTPLSQARMRFAGFCEAGGKTVSTGGVQSSTKVQQSYPGAFVYVYLPGTSTQIALYSDNSGTSMAQPVACTTTGYYDFYADDGTYDLQFTGTGIGAPFTLGAVSGMDPFFSDATSYLAGTFGARLAETISIKDAPFYAAGDGSTNDTAAILAALTMGANTNKTVVAPPGVYLVSSVDITTTGVVAMRCADPFQTVFRRHPSYLQASTPLLKVTNASGVSLRDCGWSELGNGTNYTNGASTVYLKNSNNLFVDHNYSTLGQSNAFIVDGGVGPATFTNNICDHQWNACIAIGGGGTVSSPIFINKIVAANNHCDNMPACVQVTGFADDVLITGNVARQSALSFVQHVTHGVISGNTVAGSATYGNPVGPFDCIFLEGITDFLVAGNWVSGCTKNGIFAQGSQLTIGTTEQLPIRRGSITANMIDSVGNAGVQIIGTSFDHSLIGGQWSITGNTVTNSWVGIIGGGSDGAVISSNTVSDISVDGIDLSVMKNTNVENNLVRNVGKLSVNSWYGISIGNGPTTDTKDLYINRNTIIDTLGNMRAGVLDDPAQHGTGDSVRHCGNTVSGGIIGPWFPAPAIPTFGTFVAGDCLENFSTTANAATGWYATAGGTPGTWATLGYLTSPGCVSITVPENCGTSTSGIGVIAAGSANVIVNSSAVKANNAITLMPDQSLGAALSVTCNTGVFPMHIVNRVGGAYFTAGLDTFPATNPVCFSWRVTQQ